MLLSTATVPARISAHSFPWIPELPGQKRHVRDCSLLSFIERIKLAYIIDLLIFLALMRAHLLTRCPLFCADYFYCQPINLHSVGHDRHNFPLYRATSRYSLHLQHYWSRLQLRPSEVLTPFFIQSLEREGRGWLPMPSPSKGLG